MSTLKAMIIGPFMCLVFAGCATTARTPIIAGAWDNVGVSIGGGLAEQGADVTVGYKGAKLAVVPVENQFGKVLHSRDGTAWTGFSVFAMLGLEAKGGTEAHVGVSQVVAVGKAATTWATKAALAANAERTNPPLPPAGPE